LVDKSRKGFAFGTRSMIYQSDKFLLDSQTYTFERDGRQHPVEPQVFDLLVYLIQNRDRVVSRDELLDNLWKGRIVTDSAINARLKIARKAVGDDGKQQNVIKTIHRRGYQFIYPVSEVDGQSKKETAKTPTNHSPSIAVLKFTNLSTDSAKDYFAEGMAINICTRLSRIRALRVKSVINFDTARMTAQQIAEDIDVGYLLGGSVQQDGDLVRVNVELVDGGTGEIKWSEKFNRRGATVIDIQDDVAKQVTGTLWSYSGTLREAERDHLIQKITSDFNAFDYILKGIHNKEQYTRESLIKAHCCFDKAIELDPKSAEALGWSAWTYMSEIAMGYAENTAESLTQTFIEARKAIQLDPFSEMGHWALGGALILDNDYERGIAEYDKAIEINPNNPDLLVTKGTELALYGEFEQGIDSILQGIDFNKHHPDWYFWHLGIAYFAANQLADTITALNKMDNQNEDTLSYLVASYALTGNSTEAKQQLAELNKTSSNSDLLDRMTSDGYLPEETRSRMLEGFRIAMGEDRPVEKIHLAQV